MTPPRQRLESWKEIAAYLKRDVTTVRRWERREGLPVHRHQHDKLGSVYAFADEIDRWTDQRRSAAALSAVTSESGRMTTRAVTAGLVVALLGAVTFVLWRQPNRIDESAIFRIAIEPPSGVALTGFALSPDGDHIALTGASSGEPVRLWIRRLDEIAAVPLEGTDGAAYPFWSPDGATLGFFANGLLKTVSISTREVRELAEAPDGRGGTWNRQGAILYSPGHNQPLFQVPANGGTVQRVTSLDRPHGGGHAWPEFLPDGRRFLFLFAGGWPNDHGIHVGDLTTGQVRRLVPAFSNASYSADGYLLYARDRLMAHRIDLDRLEMIGDPVPIADNVLTNYTLDHRGEFSVSRTGRLAVRYGAITFSRLVWLNRLGQELASFHDWTDYANPALSPNGQQAIVTVYRPNSANGHLWMLDLASRRWVQLTSADAVDFAPMWSPAADRFLFGSRRQQRYHLFERNVISGDGERSLATLPSLSFPEAWTPDSRYVTYSRKDAETSRDIWTLDLRDGGAAVPILRQPYNEAQSQVSPDGQLLAYTSDESGTPEVYVQGFPDVAARPRVRVSSDGGADPRWSSDGKELLYVSRTRKLMSIAVGGGKATTFDTPQPLFDLPVRALWMDMRNNYDVTADGRHFLAILPVTDPRSTSVTMIIDWRKSLR